MVKRAFPNNLRQAKAVLFLWDEKITTRFALAATAEVGERTAYTWLAQLGRKGLMVCKPASSPGGGRGLWCIKQPGRWEKQLVPRAEAIVGEWEDRKSPERSKSRTNK